MQSFLSHHPLLLPSSSVLYPNLGNQVCFIIYCHILQPFPVLHSCVCHVFAAFILLFSGRPFALSLHDFYFSLCFDFVPHFASMLMKSSSSERDGDEGNELSLPRIYQQIPFSSSFRLRGRHRRRRPRIKGQTVNRVVESCRVCPTTTLYLLNSKICTPNPVRERMRCNRGQSLAPGYESSSL